MGKQSEFESECVAVDSRFYRAVRLDVLQGEYKNSVSVSASVWLLIQVLSCITPTRTAGIGMNIYNPKYR